MSANRIELEVEARVENMATIDDFVADAMKKLGTEAQSFQVQLAVNEACANIIQYAYSGDCGQPIHISCSTMGNDLVIRIKDKGKPFEPDSVPAPDTQSGLFERELGGLGIFLMKRMMHEVRYVFRAGEYNELIMTRHLLQED
jgi:serine/threonine-protein kinase RsbW